MFMNIALIFALETKCQGNMFVAFLFRVNLACEYSSSEKSHIYIDRYVINVSSTSINLTEGLNEKQRSSIRRAIHVDVIYPILFHNIIP